MTRGTESLQRLKAAREAHPRRWCGVFDESIKQKLFADVTGAPWSLLDYVFKRIRLRSPEDEDLENILHLLCAMHALHRQGPDTHWQLGMMLGQAFKAVETRVRDRDWTLAWTYTGLPEPRMQELHRTSKANLETTMHELQSYKGTTKTDEHMRRNVFRRH